MFDLMIYTTQGDNFRYFKFFDGHVAKALFKLSGRKSMLLIHQMSERYLKMSQE